MGLIETINRQLPHRGELRDSSRSVGSFTMCGASGDVRAGLRGRWHGKACLLGTRYRRSDRRRPERARRQPVGCTDPRASADPHAGRRSNQASAGSRRRSARGGEPAPRASLNDDRRARPAFPLDDLVRPETSSPPDRTPGSASWSRHSGKLALPAPQSRYLSHDDSAGSASWARHLGKLALPAPQSRYLSHGDSAGSASWSRHPGKLALPAADSRYPQLQNHDDGTLRGRISVQPE